MLGLLIRYPIWAVRSLRRRLRRAPDYVAFTLEGEYPELPRDPGNLILRRLRPPKLSLHELGEQFRQVAGDPRVKGVVLHLRTLQMPPAAIESLRDLVAELRAAGKRVVAWATFYVPSNYLVACAADEILMQPAGEVQTLGMARTYPYLGRALKKAGVQGDFLSISPYKSAADVLTRKDMSKEVRQMANWLMDSAYEQRLQVIAEGRGLDLEAAGGLVDQTPATDERALELGLVDRLMSEEDLASYLGSGDAPARLAPWETARKSLRLPRPVRANRYLAVIPIEGTIVDGQSGRPPLRPPVDLPILTEARAGDLTVVQAARQALRDRRAAGVVLYVDSRGGSASASEAMRAALEKVAAEKPLVVSMGPVAASGGYWVSTPGQYIFAQPSTVTGSIGVIVGKLVARDLLDRLFIGRESIERGEHAGIFDLESKFSKAERALMWESVRHIYDLFLDRVSQSRSMSRQRVDDIGGGRVWTGRQGLENGLVDELGGLQAALRKARELAGLPPGASARVVTQVKLKLVPAAQPAAMLEYAKQGVELMQNARPLCLSPFSLDRT